MSVNAVTGTGRMLIVEFLYQAYLHSRMRARTSEFIKILNRARPEPKTTEKKTMRYANPPLL